MFCVLCAQAQRLEPHPTAVAKMAAQASCAMPAVRAGAQIPFRRGAPKRSAVRARAVEAPPNLERLRITTPWDDAKETLRSSFGMSEQDIEAAGSLSDEDLTKAYTMMQTCRDFENECNQVGNESAINQTIRAARR